MTKNKTILFIPPVHWNYYPYRDQELPAALARKGYRCIYLNPVRYKGCETATRFTRVNERGIPDGMKVIDRSSRLGKSFILFIRENYLNCKTVRKLRPDAVISSNHLMALFTCLYCRMKGIRFVFDVTDDWELADPTPAGRFYKHIIKPLIARYAYAVTSTSHNQFKYFRSKRHQNTFLISNGISPFILDKLRHIKKTTGDEKAVNFIGSLRDWYDFDLLLSVFRDLPEITLNIYGQGTLFRLLEERSKKEGNIFVHGYIEQHSVPQLLRNSLFGVLPLKKTRLNNSTCPIKLFEYWGASKAVIATPVEEVKKVGGEAVLYASDKNEFIRYARLLLQNTDLREKLGKQARQKIEETHNYDMITRRFIEIIEN
ncbi:MAG: glycosyltransferase [Bacteroidales bacterium]|nr:glycosyltransferase [Bacteroidales bacterium]